VVLNDRVQAEVKDRCRYLSVSLVLVFLLASGLPAVPGVLAGTGDITVPQGETLVIDQDTEVDGDITIHGTLVIDGVEFKTYTGGFPSDDCLVSIYGTLRIINGARFIGGFKIQVLSAGSLEILDSELTYSPSHLSSAIGPCYGRVLAVNSTISSTNVLLSADHSNLTFIKTNITIKNNWMNGSAISIGRGTDLVMDRVRFTSEAPVLRGREAGNVTIRDCEFLQTDGDVVSLEGAANVSVTGSLFDKGSGGLVISEAENVSVADCTMKGLDGYGCYISWSNNVTVNGLTVAGCVDVALNITNCTNVTVNDLDVNGVDGDAIGIMSEHNSPFTAKNVTVRYADKGVYMIYTNDVTLTDVSVDWCRKIGLQLSHCDGVDITRLSATEAGIDGLYAGHCKGLSIENSNLDGADECGAFLTHTPTSMTRVTARSCGQYGIRAAVNSVFLVSCDLSYNGIDGFLSLDQGGAGITNCTIEGNGGNGTRFVAARGPFVKESKITNNGGAGILAHYETRAADVIDCDIEGNGWGVVLNGPTMLSAGSSVTVRYTYIHNNTEGGALNFLDNSSNLDARYCWWGSNTGPRNETRNVGGTGDLIQGGVKFIPWLKVGNLLPVIDGPVDLEVEEEAVVQYFYDADDLDDDKNKIRFGLSGEPGNVTIGPTSGILTVAPEDAEVGAHSFFITATDERGGEGRLRVTLLVTPVNDRPQILVPEGGLIFGDDDSVRLQLRAYDPDSPIPRRSWYVIEGPEWLELSAEGMLTGTTTWRERGSHSITLRVEDGDGGKDTETIPIHVVPAYEPIVITGLNTTTAFEGRPYSADVLITYDEEAVVVWEYITNASWLALDVDGARLIGTPALKHVGNYALQLTVSDQFGHMTTVDLIIEVVPFNDPPFWVDLPSEVRVRTDIWDMDLTPFVRDVDDPVHTLSFSVDGKDSRLQVQRTFLVGMFDIGDKDAVINVTVTDPHGASADQLIRIIVAIPPEPDPSPTVSDLFPWVLIVLVTALGTGLVLSHLERRRKEREDI